MSLTRLTFCLGLLILLSGVTAMSQLGGGASTGVSNGPVPPMVSIPKGGAGMLETEDHVFVYDQERGKGKIISKTTTVDDDGKPQMHEFVIK